MSSKHFWLFGKLIKFNRNWSKFNKIFLADYCLSNIDNNSLIWERHFPLFLWNLPIYEWKMIPFSCSLVLKCFLVFPGHGSWIHRWPNIWLPHFGFHSNTHTNMFSNKQIWIRIVKLRFTPFLALNKTIWSGHDLFHSGASCYLKPYLRHISCGFNVCGKNKPIPLHPLVFKRSDFVDDFLFWKAPHCQSANQTKAVK